MQKLIAVLAVAFIATTGTAQTDRPYHKGGVKTEQEVRALLKSAAEARDLELLFPELKGESSDIFCNDVDAAKVEPTTFRAGSELYVLGRFSEGGAVFATWKILQRDTPGWQVVFANSAKIPVLGPCGNPATMTIGAGGMAATRPLPVVVAGPIGPRGLQGETGPSGPSGSSGPSISTAEINEAVSRVISEREEAEAAATRRPWWKHRPLGWCTGTRTQQIVCGFGTILGVGLLLGLDNNHPAEAEKSGGAGPQGNDI